MKFGDVVIYEEGGKQYNATVLGPLTLPHGWKSGDPVPVGRDLADHVGANDEPLINLGFFKESIDMFGKPNDLSGTGSFSKLLQMRIDVAHKSHEYSDEAKKRFGARYEGGRWSEVTVTKAPTAADLDAAQGDAEQAGN
jgi:hypothetical protein